MRQRVGDLVIGWRNRGHDLGFGVGVSVGFATIGLVGFEGRYDYAATGQVLNFASRLCDKADDGQVLVSEPILAKVKKEVETEFIGDMSFKGFQRPASTYNVLAVL